MATNNLAAIGGRASVGPGGPSPIVSVCVSNYNYGRFLPDLIESVRQQTFTDWELVITDDQSDDGSEETVQRCAQGDHRIRFIRNERRLGMNGNLHRAASSGTGKYLKILCADDWLTPNALEVLVRVMERQPNASILTSAAILTDEDGRPVRLETFFGASLSVLSGEYTLDLLAGGTIWPGGNSDYFISASAFKQVGGYDTTLLYAGDYGLVVRLCRVGDFVHIDEPLTYWRGHSARSSMNDPARLYDLADWLAIPRRYFQPRRLFNREWWRYQKATARVTASYATTAISQFVAGNRSYARAVMRLLWQEGNILVGALYVPVHAVKRLYRKAMHNDPWTMLPPRPGMGSPSWLRRNVDGKRTAVPASTDLP